MQSVHVKAQQFHCYVLGLWLTQKEVDEQIIQLLEKDFEDAV